jgi:hypothetical protein
LQGYRRYLGDEIEAVRRRMTTRYDLRATVAKRDDIRFSSAFDESRGGYC